MISRAHARPLVRSPQSPKPPAKSQPANHLGGNCTSKQSKLTSCSLRPLSCVYSNTQLVFAKKFKWPYVSRNVGFLYLLEVTSLIHSSGEFIWVLAGWTGCVRWRVVHHTAGVGTWKEGRCVLVAFRRAVLHTQTQIECGVARDGIDIDDDSGDGMFFPVLPIWMECN